MALPAAKPDTCDVPCLHPEAVGAVRQTLIPHEEARGLADVFSVLADPSRVRLLAALAKRELCVCDLANVLGLRQSTVSHQLRLLRVVRFRIVAHAAPIWKERYGRRAEDNRLPGKQAARDALALTIGADGYTLLLALYADTAPTWLREIPAVETLRRVWIQQYCRDGVGFRWRASGDLPPASVFISSPYDEEAHYARKRSTQWVGYKVHITETCGRDQPHLITNVETTSGPTADGAATPLIHAALQERDLLPSDHVVDTGFLDAELLVSSRDEYNVELLGPVRDDHHWQARTGAGFAAAHFAIDWEQRRATCPAGRMSSSWTPAVDNRTNAVIKIKFSPKDCRACASRPQCYDSTKPDARWTIMVRPQAQHAALLAARERQETAAFAVAYRARAGIEGTISRAIRTCTLRRTRYIGQERTHLGHVFTATALNFLRLGEWLTEPPRARSRRSPFTRLMAEAAVA